MGMLVDGQWQDVWYDTKRSGGCFVRSKSQFRNWITKDGSPGPSGEGGFKAASGRYYLYASRAMDDAGLSHLNALSKANPQGVCLWSRALVAISLCVFDIFYIRIRWVIVAILDCHGGLVFLR